MTVNRGTSFGCEYWCVYVTCKVLNCSRGCYKAPLDYNCSTKTGVVFYSSNLPTRGTDGGSSTVSKVHGSEYCFRFLTPPGPSPGTCRRAW